MEIQGRIQDGVVVLAEGLSLPEGTPVVVYYPVPATNTSDQRKVEFPLVRSQRPGTIMLTSDRVAELLGEEDVSS